MKKIANIKNKQQAGYTTLEIMIAFFIFTISIAGITSVAFGNQSMSVDTVRNNDALQIAQTALEDVRAAAKENFDSVKSDPAPVDITGYNKQVQIETLGQNEKKVTATVSWTTDLRQQSVVLTSLLTNAVEQLADGGCTSNCVSGGPTPTPILTPTPTPTPGCTSNCSGTTPVNYCPSSVTILGGLNSALEDGSVAMGLDVLNNIVYLAVQPDLINNPTGNDLVLVNVADTKNPQVISQFSTGSGGLNAVRVVKDSVSGKIYAYGVSQNGNGQMQIIDVTNPLAPVLVSSFKLSNIASNFTPGLALFYHKDILNNKAYLYVGTAAASSGPEFNIVDVTDPYAPSIAGSYKVGAAVNKIYVRGNVAYAVTKDPTQEVLVLDITNQSPTLSYSYNDPGSTGGQSFYFLNNQMYVGTAPGVVGGTVAHNAFNILDSGSGNPNLVGSGYVGATVLDISVSSNLAYMATENPYASYNFPAPFHIFDVSNPESPVACTTNISFVPTLSGINSQNGILYVSLQSQDGLKIIQAK